MKGWAGPVTESFKEESPRLADATSTEPATASGVAALAEAGLALRGKEELFSDLNVAPTASTPHQQRCERTALSSHRGPTGTYVRFAAYAR